MGNQWWIKSSSRGEAGRCSLTWSSGVEGHYIKADLLGDAAASPLPSPIRYCVVLCVVLMRCVPCLTLKSSPFFRIGSWIVLGSYRPYEKSRWSGSRHWDSQLSNHILSKIKTWDMTSFGERRLTVFFLQRISRSKIHLAVDIGYSLLTYLCAGSKFFTSTTMLTEKSTQWSKRMLFRPTSSTLWILPTWCWHVSTLLGNTVEFDDKFCSRCDGFFLVRALVSFRFMTVSGHIQLLWILWTGWV